MFEICSLLGVLISETIVKKHMEEVAPEGQARHSGCRLYEFVLHHNYGSAANLGAGNPKLVKVFSVLLSLWCTVFFIISFTLGGAKTLRVGLGLLLGGAYSNTYDRLKKGYVTDYIRFKKGPKVLRRLIWNISDFAIIIGALIAVIGS